MTHRARIAIVCWVCLVAYARAAPTTQPRVEYSIVITGGELLEGAIVDGHTPFLTRTLHPMGLHCMGVMIVDDKQEDIRQALRVAMGKAKLVIVTGGLGPTDNDVTRQALAGFTGIGLKEHPAVIGEMEKRFGTPRDKLRANLRRQARVPERGTYLKNANGTAVGLVFEMEDGVVVALPGPPRELQPMVKDELVPYLGKKFGVSKPGAALTLRFVGVGQSQISQTMKENVAVPGDVTLFSQFEGSRVDFTFVLPGDGAEERRRLEELKAGIGKVLGEYIYSDDGGTLEDCVGKLLSERGAKLVVAEVGSGGSLAAGLNGAESGRAVLVGAYVAPTEEKLRRMVGVGDEVWKAAGSAAERARLIAGSAGKVSGAEWVVVVGEVGPEGVEVVLGRPGKVESVRVSVRGGGEMARSGLATGVLDQMRRRWR